MEGNTQVIDGTTPISKPPSGVENARNAEREVWQQSFSPSCVTFLNAIGSKGNPLYTASTLQVQALSSSFFIFDGNLSLTPISWVGAEGESSDTTFGFVFRHSPNIGAVSNPNGPQIWVQANAFASADSMVNGKPTSLAKAMMLHEDMHKFGLNDGRLKQLMGIPETTNSFAITLEVQKQCEQ